jgi:hypothetical protein
MHGLYEHLNTNFYVHVTTIFDISTNMSTLLKNFIIHEETVMKFGITDPTEMQ